ncbi:MAG: DUF1667 domain-containing protein [Firmicutes bacterium]|nr:DUF1667 domain-containing protein [Bacillota bacterium]
MTNKVLTKTCIVCPIGCELSITIDENNEFVSVSGNQCRRGEDYAVNEINNPQRVITTTVAIDSKELRLLPVRTKEAIPKDLIFAAMKELEKVKVQAPVKVGDVIIADLLGTGVPVIAARNAK